MTGLAVVATIFGPAHHRRAQAAPVTTVTTVTTITTPAPTDPPTTPLPTTTIPPPPVTLAAAPAPVPSTGRCVPAPLPPIPVSSDLASPKVAGLAYSDAPGGPTVGHLPATSWGGPTVRPVVGEQAGWLQVRLERRPNGSTGWVRQQDVDVAPTAYRIVISTCRRALTLFQDGLPIFSSPVGVGRPGSPTPPGPSFVNAVVSTSRRQQSIYGPTVLITASHSNVYTDFDGGDGTVGIHGYPSDPASTAGVASSHGCIRANPQTITAISKVPLGTPIDIVT